MPAFYTREYLHRLLPIALQSAAVVFACAFGIGTLNQTFGLAGYYLACALTSVVLVGYSALTYYRLVTKPLPLPREPFPHYQTRVVRGLYQRADILEAVARALDRIAGLEHFIARLNNHAEIYRFTADAIVALEQA